MKAGVVAVAAAIASGAAAGHAGRRHAHEAFHLERGLLLTTGKAAEPTCGCTTIYTTIYGEATLIFPSSTYSSMAPPTTSSSTTTKVAPSSTYSPKPTTSTTCPPATVPTPFATTCSTTGVYTIPATTVTITESTTVCAATGTHIPSGSHTAGGVTTTVTGSTTVTCPYATTSTSAGVVTSTILTTTYVCHSAGTYTIAPLTTVCETETFWVYPTAASYAPGTYTQAEVVTTITETDYVVFCPYTSPAPVKTSAAVTYAPIVSTYTPVVSTYAPVVESYTSSAPKASSTKTSSSSGGQLGSSGNQWAITYSPYENSGSCKGASDVMYDIGIIAGKGFSTVRVYSTDCSGLENIGAACEAHGLKMIIGIFISNTGISGAAEQVTSIVSWGKWSLVELVVIGNECVFSGFATAGELAGFISSCKSTFASAGYTGPCTTAEPLNIWQENIGALCGAVDVVGCNIHPFFNADVDASSAGDFVASQLALVDGLCSGKYGVNLETGWPSAGSCNGKACPGASEQATAIKSITEKAGGKSVMFSYVDDFWKEPGAFGCEQSWGAIQLFN